MGDGGANLGFRELLAQGLDGVECFVDGPVTVRMHMGLEAIAGETQQQRLQDGRGKIDRRAAIRTGSPAWLSRRASICEVRFEHGPREGRRGDDTVQKQLGVVNGNSRGRLQRALVKLGGNGLDVGNRFGGIEVRRRPDRGRKVTSRCEIACVLHGRE
jgi:hypothetical protein